MIDVSKQLKACNCPECKHYQYVVNNNLYILIDDSEIDFLETIEKIRQEIAKNVGLPTHLLEIKPMQTTPKWYAK
jgi:hypothetical protein